MSKYGFSTKSKQRMEDVHPDLIKVANRAIEISKIDFGIPQYGGVRTALQQRSLYDDGKSQLDGVKKKSYHQTGRALDVFAYVDGKASWDKYHLTQIAVAFFRAAMELGIQIEWGGNWTSFVDMPHFQLPD